MRTPQALPTYLALVPLLLSACVTTQEAMVKKGFPPAYAQGFDDGCHSGKKAGGSLFEQFKKDVARFEKDKEYAMGWSDAFRQCETEQENALRQQRMALEQNRLKELRKQNQLAKDHELEREALTPVG